MLIKIENSTEITADQANNEKVRLGVVNKTYSLTIEQYGIYKICYED